MRGTGGSDHLAAVGELSLGITVSDSRWLPSLPPSVSFFSGLLLRDNENGGWKQHHLWVDWTGHRLEVSSISLMSRFLCDFDGWGFEALFGVGR